MNVKYVQSRGNDFDPIELRDFDYVDIHLESKCDASETAYAPVASIEDKVCELDAVTFEKSEQVLALMKLQLLDNYNPISYSEGMLSYVICLII